MYNYVLQKIKMYKPHSVHIHPHRMSQSQKIHVVIPKSRIRVSFCTLSWQRLPPRLKFPPISGAHRLDGELGGPLVWKAFLETSF